VAFARLTDRTRLIAAWTCAVASAVWAFAVTLNSTTPQHATMSVAAILLAFTPGTVTYVATAFLVVSIARTRMHTTTFVLAVLPFLLSGYVALALVGSLVDRLRR
jgi:hypothetical protein